MSQTTMGKYFRSAFSSHKPKLSQKKVALQAGLNFNTLRTHMARNEFTRTEVTRLQALLGAAESPDELLEKHPTASGTFLPDRVLADQMGSFEVMLARCDREGKRIAKTVQDMNVLYGNWLDTLGRGCFQAVVTETLTPIEMEEVGSGESWRVRIAGAIARGAIFLYIRPDDVRLERNRELWKLARVLSMADQLNEIEKLKERLGELLIESGMTKKDVEKKLATQVGQIYVQECPFYAHGHSFGLVYGEDADHDPVARMTIRTPASPGLLWVNKEIHSYRFYTFLRTAVTAERAKETAKGTPDKQVLFLYDTVLKMLRSYHGLQSTQKD